MPRPRRSRKIARLILHIGLPKTGTTSLQRTLSRERKVLEDHNILYPALGPWPDAHHGLVPHLVGLPFSDAHVLDRLGAKPHAASAQLLTQLTALAAQSDATILLSSENFSAVAQPDQGRRVLSLLAALGRPIEVVCYLRDPVAFYLSALSTHLQAGGTMMPVPADARRRALEGYLGADCLTVRRFETAQDGDIVADFAQHVLKLPPDSLKNAAGRVNRTLSAEALSVMQARTIRLGRTALMPLRRRDLAFRQALRWADSRVPGWQRPHLRAGMAEAITAASTDLDWLKAQTGHDLRAGSPQAPWDSPDRIDALCEINTHRRARLAQILAPLAAVLK